MADSINGILEGIYRGSKIGNPKQINDVRDREGGENDSGSEGGDNEGAGSQLPVKGPTAEQRDHIPDGEKIDHLYGGGSLIGY